MSAPRPAADLSCVGVVASPGGAPVLRDIDLDVPAGTRTVLVGPSGAGKTTLLRAVAGLEPLNQGSVSLGERRLDRLPPHRRNVAVVFQEPRLLPHLSVQDNVALALRAAGVGAGERRTRARALLSDVGLGGFADRRVQGLSGGEQQRVSLARALCAEPDLLMLDEPLAALDPNRREALRSLIVELQCQRGVTTLIVTHDRGEAAELGDRIALMLEGRIVQYDEPRVLFEQPATAAAARFFGAANIVRGTVRGGLMAVGDGDIAVPGRDGPATFVIRPEHVSLGGPLEAVVAECVYAGTLVRLKLFAGEQRLLAHVPTADAPPAGSTVGVSLPTEHLWRLRDDDGLPVNVPDDA